MVLLGSTAETAPLQFCKSVISGLRYSAAVFASSHDCGVQTITQIVRHLVNLMAPIDLNRLLRSVEDDFAVAAFLQVHFDFSAGLCGN